MLVTLNVTRWTVIISLCVLLLILISSVFFFSTHWDLQFFFTPSRVFLSTSGVDFMLKLAIRTRRFRNISLDKGVLILSTIYAEFSAVPVEDSS